MYFQPLSTRTGAFLYLLHGETERSGKCSEKDVKSALLSYNIDGILPVTL